eukprot:2270576-Rhodomonas_salina.1
MLVAAHLVADAIVSWRDKPEPLVHMHTALHTSLHTPYHIIAHPVAHPVAHTPRACASCWRRTAVAAQRGEGRQERQRPCG